MIRAGVIGATGYAGAELIRLLTGHPEVQVVWYGSKSYIDQRFADIYKNFFRIVDATCLDDNPEALAREADVIFTATPQGLCASLISDRILQETKVIDLSADFRFRDVSVYEKWYGITHAAPGFCKEAVYGLCELKREEIRGARLVANPGCYTTCSILTLYPAVEAGLIDPDTIIVDALSGVSGAGRGLKTDNLFCEVNENVKPYGVTNHRHTPEIEAALSEAAGKPVTLNFTPHLVPVQRGILATCYASLVPVTKPGGETGYPTEEEIRAVYEKRYAKERFVRLLPEGVVPETRWVENSNYLDIAIKVDPRTHRVILMGALDNLVKGAAGQAVQNMNLLFGLDEATGLGAVPAFP